MIDTEINSVYYGVVMEISITQFNIWKPRGATALISAIFIARPVNISGLDSGAVRLTSYLLGWMLTGFNPLFVFNMTGSGQLNQKESAMQNVINFPTKHLPVYQDSPDEMVILSSTLKYLQKKWDKQIYLKPYDVYGLVKQAVQEIREEQFCKK